MQASRNPSPAGSPRLACERAWRSNPRAASWLPFLVLALLVAACGGAQSASPAGPVKLVVGLGYIPNVQFAQFYLAEQAGYYRDAGLQVELQNKTDPELVTLVGQGAVDVGISDGTSVIPAVSQGIPIRYVFSVFAQFPNVVFSKAASGIATTAALRGRKIGIPGKFGSSWIQLEGLLAGAGLTTADVQLVLFPDFGQLAALQQGAVEAATGYANNEPVQMALGGQSANVLALPPASQLPGPGLIVAAAALGGPKAGALRAFVAATQRAMRDIEADPAKGVDAAIAQVPALASARPAQLAVLQATIALWESDYTRASGLGAVDPALWDRSISFMAGLPDKLLAKPVTTSDCTSTALLPAP